MTTADKQKPLTIIAMALAVTLLGLAIYLTAFSVTGKAVAGCGAGSGCGEVLASKWSRVGPVPVSVLAALTYLAMLVGFVSILRSDSKFGAAMLLVAAPTLPVAGLWFTYVQRVELDAICPFCMITHGLGLVLFCLTCWIAIPRHITKPLPPLGIGIIAAGLLIPLQLFATHQPPPQRAPNPFAQQDGDTWIQDARYVSLFGGELQFVLQDVPHLGDPNAQHVVAVLFDYACPHCKTLHDLLDQAIRDEPSRFVLAPIPLSIYEGQSPYIGSDARRFEDSADLAMLSLAVAEIDPDKWKRFDRWLFATDGGQFPRSAKDAREKAETLVASQALNNRLTGENRERILAQIQRNVDLVGLIPEAKRAIPITTTPGAPSHLTARYDNIEVLHQLLDATQTPTSTPEN